MFHLNFYLWFVDLRFNTQPVAKAIPQGESQDTVRCNSLSASTTVVKISLHRQMRGCFFFLLRFRITRHLSTWLLHCHTLLTFLLFISFGEMDGVGVGVEFESACI